MVIRYIFAVLSNKTSSMNKVPRISGEIIFYEWKKKSYNIRYCNKKKIYNNKGNYNIQFAEPFANKNFGILTIEYLRGSTQSSENGYIHF